MSILDIRLSDLQVERPGTPLMVLGPRSLDPLLKDVLDEEDTMSHSEIPDILKKQHPF